ncbi:MAG: hypothetical protein LUQ55_02455 [Methanomassiliicoccales archaeon]|nr:hypothetical protein [Methanomassiliicoccales archaeon]
MSHALRDGVDRDSSIEQQLSVGPAEGPDLELHARLPLDPSLDLLDAILGVISTLASGRQARDERFIAIGKAGKTTPWT